MQYRKSPLVPLPVPASPVLVTVNVAGARRSSNGCRDSRRARVRRPRTERPEAGRVLRTMMLSWGGDFGAPVISSLPAGRK